LSVDGKKELFKNKKWAHKAIAAWRDIPAGKDVEADDLTSIRPCNEGKGHISIAQFYEVVGKSTRKEIKKGEYVLSNDLQ